MKDVGLVLVREESADDRFIAALVHGLEEELVRAGLRLATRVVGDRRGEREAYRRWARRGVVDAVVLIGTRGRDDRVDLLRGLGLPFVALIDAERVETFSAVIMDNAGMAGVVLRFLAANGYRRLVYGAGGRRAEVSRIRGAALLAGAGAAGIEVLQSEEALEDVLRVAQEFAEARPTAIVFDDDVTAVAALDLLRADGVGVPEELAVVSWADSVVCQSSDPPVTAVNARANEVGALLGECLLRSAASSERVLLTAPRPFIVARASA